MWMRVVRRYVPIAIGVFLSAAACGDADRSKAG
jgi:hypothetical protein